MSLSVGDRIGGFEVLGQLGEGGLAVVYQVRHLQLGSLHALKVPKIPSDPIVDRLMAEGRVQARLRHPNLVPVTDILDVEGYPGLLMEFVDGPTLREVLDQGPLPLAEASRLGEELLAGVAFAHVEGVVHRDIKPANVLLQTGSDGQRHPRLTDFGMVKLLSTEGGGSHRTRTGMVMGTPAYMAPEQVRDASRVDARADVFSLGAVLYELLCGQPAFQADNVLGLMVAASKGDFEPPDMLVPELPEPVVLALYTALEVDPAQRFADAGALRAAWSATALPPAGPGPAPRRPPAASERPADRPLAARPDPAPDSRPPVPVAEAPASPRAPRGRLWGGLALALAAASAGVALWPAPEQPLPVVDPGGAPRATGLRTAPAPTPSPAAAAPAPPVESPPPPRSPPRSEPAAPAPAAPESAAPEPAAPEPAAPEPPAPEPPAPEPAARAVPPPASPRKPPPEDSPADAVPDDPDPEPAPAPPTTSVSVTGDADRVYLVGPAGPLPPGELPPGTYTIRAFFGGDPQPVDQGRITLREGDTRVVSCTAGLQMCR